MHIESLFDPPAPCRRRSCGIIGTDTPHVSAFARVLNDHTAPDHLPGAPICQRGSADIEEGANSVDRCADQLKRKWSVKIVDFTRMLGTEARRSLPVREPCCRLGSTSQKPLRWPS